MPARQRLKRAKPKKPVTPHRRSMNRVYTVFYRRRLKSTGSPDRRAIAEALLTTVLLCSNGLEESAERSFARTILDRSGRLLLDMIDENGRQRYTPRQIKLRWDKLLSEIERNRST